MKLEITSNLEYYECFHPSESDDYKDGVGETLHQTHENLDVFGISHSYDITDMDVYLTIYQQELILSESDLLFLQHTILDDMFPDWRKCVIQSSDENQTIPNCNGL